MTALGIGAIAIVVGLVLAWFAGRSSAARRAPRLVAPSPETARDRVLVEEAAADPDVTTRRRRLAERLTQMLKRRSPR